MTITKTVCDKCGEETPQTKLIPVKGIWANEQPECCPLCRAAAAAAIESRSPITK